MRYRSLLQLLLIEGAAFLFVMAVYFLQIPIQCPFKWLTGFPCPGCGGTRVLVALLHGQIIEALNINPLSVIVILFAVAAPIWLFVDCYNNTNSLQKVMRAKWSNYVTYTVAVIVLINWMWNLYKHL